MTPDKISKAAKPAFTKPTFILVRPQLPENIGTAFRALVNCGLTDLRLVAPKRWPDEKGRSAAAGAEAFIESVQVFETLQHATADLNTLFATTTRDRDMIKPVYTLPDFWSQVAGASMGKVGILFGPERSGLNSEDLSWAAGILTIPLNPAYSSLNLAQAVLLVAYHWVTHNQKGHSFEKACPPPLPYDPQQKRPATGKEFQDLWNHFEGLVGETDFFYPPELKPRMVRNLRNIFTRAHLTDQEVKTLRGILAAFGKKMGK